jgi:hypothetical protein
VNYFTLAILDAIASAGGSPSQFIEGLLELKSRGRPFVSGGGGAGAIDLSTGKAQPMLGGLCWLTRSWPRRGRPHADRTVG